MLYEWQRLQKEKENPYYKSVPVSDCYKQDERYISMMGSMSHTYGNALAYIQNYVLDLFPKDLFKTIHVNSKIAHRQIRSTAHEFVKKTKPIIIFRPRIASMDEDKFLRGTRFIERQTDLYNTYGATNLQNFITDNKHDLTVKYQMNRSVLYVDVVCIFSTLMQQIDYAHYLQNATRVNRPFTLETFFESYIPQEMLGVISEISGVPLYDKGGSTKEFLTYLEGNSIYPVTYKLQGSSGTKEFYRLYPVHIDTVISDITTDEGEKNGHIMSAYQMQFTVRMEFNSTGFFYLFSNHLDHIKMPETHAEDTSVIPFFTDVICKEDLNLRQGWHLYHQASVMLETENDVINIKELMNNSIMQVLKYHLNNGLPLMEFLDIKVRQQGKLLTPDKEYHIDYDTLDLTFKDVPIYFTYKILVCINVEYVNDLIKTIYNLK